MKKIIGMIIAVILSMLLISCDLNPDQTKANADAKENSKIEHFFEMCEAGKLNLYIRDNCYVNNNEMPIKRYKDVIDVDKETVDIIKQSNYMEDFEYTSKGIGKYNYELGFSHGINIWMFVHCKEKRISITRDCDCMLAFSTYTRYYKLDDESFDKLVDKIETLLKSNDVSD